MPINTTDRATYSTSEMLRSIIPAAICIMVDIDSLAPIINAHIEEPAIDEDNVNTLVFTRLSEILKNEEVVDDIIAATSDYEQQIFEKIKTLDPSILDKIDDFLVWASNLTDIEAIQLVDLELPEDSTDLYILAMRELIENPVEIKNEVTRALSESDSPTGPIVMTYDFDRGTYVSSTYSGIRPYEFLDHSIYGVIWEGIDPTTASQADLDTVAERKEVLDMLKMGTTTVSGKIYNLKSEEALPAAVIDKLKDDAKAIIAENPSIPKHDALHLALKISAQLGTVAKDKLTR